MTIVNHGTSPSGEPDNVPEWDENRVALALGRLTETLPTLIKDLVGVYNHLLDLDGDNPVCCDGPNTLFLTVFHDLDGDENGVGS